MESSSNESCEPTDMVDVKQSDNNEISANDAFKAPLFKVPTFIKKNTIKIEKSPPEHEKSSNKDKDDGQLSNKDTAAIPDEKSPNVTKEKRPLISFQPKSLTLPSQVYKPHRPSATEYLKHYKKDKERKQQNIEKTSPTVAENSSTKPSSVKSAKQEGSASKSKSTKLKYEKPQWSCACEENPDLAYSLEVLKGGSIIDKISLANKEFFVFGRLSDCDIVLEHPSISRHHAILQFGRPTENDDVEFQKDGSAGFYLYDLGSTHGTCLNKASVPSLTYYRVKVGHMMKFGGSSRLYILQGPEVDEEDEAKETATELREKARAARNKKDLAKMMMGDDSDEELDEEKTVSRKRQDNEDTGVTWGMLEDAVMESDEENEDDAKAKELTFSLADGKEPFYVKDPSKALNNFYEKEGLEIDFECTERRPGQWNVRLELPIDTPTGKAVVAEVSLTGKRKDAVNNCAIEACRLLDKYGMFKQSEHHRRKLKEWEKEDFYDSDEDQYWDRTGDLDKKRQQRKIRIGVKMKKNEERPETYESLKKQIDDLEKEIADIEKQLEKDRKAVQTKEDSKDPLEEFMMQVKSGKTLDSITRSKLKRRLLEARKESSRLLKLADVARPSSLPSLAGQSTKSLSFIGKMKGKKKGLSVQNTNKFSSAPVYKSTSSTDDVIEEEEEEDEVASQQEEQNLDKEKPTATVTTSKDAEPNIAEEASRDSEPLSSEKSSMNIETSPERKSSLPDQSSSNGSATDEVSQYEETETVVPPPSAPVIVEKPSTRKRTFGPTLPQDLKERLLAGGSSSNDSKEANSSKSKKRKQRKQSSRNFDSNRSSSNDPNYADWIPPEDQSGDGTTSLNAKYGY